MKMVLALALCILSTASSQALLGESVAELKRRYGRPLDAEGTKDVRTDRYSFRWESYLVAVTVQEGRSVSEEFTRWDRREFTLEELRTLLAESSAPGAAWSQVDGSTWKQRDRVAAWSGRSLLVQDKARRD